MEMREVVWAALDREAPGSDGAEELEVGRLLGMTPAVRRALLHLWLEARARPAASRAGVLAVESLLSTTGSAERSLGGGWRACKEYDRLTVRHGSGAQTCAPPGTSPDQIGSRLQGRGQCRQHADPPGSLHSLIGHRLVDPQDRDFHHSGSYFDRWTNRRAGDQNGVGSCLLSGNDMMHHTPGCGRGESSLLDHILDEAFVSDIENLKVGQFRFAQLLKHCDEWQGRMH